MATTAAELTKLVETVLAAAKKAEAGDAAEQGRAMDGLKALKKSRVSTKLLADTQAGKRVKSLTKHPKAALAAAAAEVVAAWKEVVKKEAAASGGGGGTATAAAAAAAASGATSGASGGGLLARAGSQATVEDAPASQRSGSQALGSQAAGGPPLDLDAVPRCGDSLRDKCRQNLAAAMNLAVGEGVVGDPIVCGVAVENEIFKQANNQVSQVRLRVLPLPRSLLLAVCTILQAGTGRRDSTNLQPVGLLSAWHRRRAARAALVPGTRPAWQQAPLCQPSACASPPAAQAYKAKFRNLHFNLKDAANPDLRRKVLSGQIAPDVLVVLPPEELASDAKKEENARIREKKLFDSAPSAVKQATTDQFQCGKCRQRKTTYYQMQTRSADEPMTTFVTCLVCNNRWKFC
ncbi:hypothetical protein ABPG77_001988 [Micractinium sp. CCAP 211/92]